MITLPSHNEFPICTEVIDQAYNKPKCTTKVHVYTHVMFVECTHAVDKLYGFISQRLGRRTVQFTDSNPVCTCPTTLASYLAFGFDQEKLFMFVCMSCFSVFLCTL